MTDAEVLAALQTKVRAAVVAETTPSLPIAYIGVNFTPPASKRWIEIVRVSNNTSPFLAKGKRFAGLLRIILHWPKDGGGTLSPMTIMAAIAGHFEKGATFDGIKVAQTMMTGDPVPTDTDVMYPATCRYEVLTFD